MTTDGWTVASTIATGVAALATGASAIFIAAQTKATKDALAEARNSLRLANTQAQQSLRLVIEAVKTRLDSRSPKLSSRLISGTQSPQSFWLSDDNSDSAELSPVEPGAVFNSPQQDDKYLWAAVVVEIHNGGPGPAEITFHPAARRPVGGSIGESVPRVTLMTEDKTKLLLLVGTTISGWIEAGQLYAKGKPSRLAQGSWQALLREQEGVAQYQRLEIEGSILRDHGKGQWRLVGTTDINNCPAFIHENAIVRTYILDKYADELLPEVEWASMTPAPLDPPKEGVSS